MIARTGKDWQKINFSLVDSTLVQDSSGKRTYVSEKCFKTTVIVGQHLVSIFAEVE